MFKVKGKSKMWGLTIYVLIYCFGPTAGDDALSAVWNEIVSKSEDVAQCQTCVHIRNYLDQTLPDHEIKSMRIEALKQTILKKLGMTEPPKFSSPSKPLPRPVKDGTLTLEKAQSMPFHHVTERVIMLFSNHECSKEDEVYKMSLTLEIPSNLMLIDINDANMWIYTGNAPLHSYHIEASPCDENDGNLKDSQEFPRTSFKDGWSIMDITWTLGNWLEYGSLCHKIVISCDSPNICEKHIADDPSKKPFIHVDIAPNHSQHKREKRNLNCVKGSSECCRESLLVSFKDIGWDDWIIHPTVYNAYFCKGTCANAATLSLSKAPYHAVIRKYNLVPHRHLDIIPCCTAARLSPLQIIYKDQNNTFLQRIIQDLTVESCGCM